MKIRKVVINRCFGGFGLSFEALRWLADAGVTDYEGDIPRDNEMLVACVEQLGDVANGNHAKLKVVEIPYDVVWDIHDYDGMEHVEEVHRTWC